MSVLIQRLTEDYLPQFCAFASENQLAFSLLWAQPQGTHPR